MTLQLRLYDDDGNQAPLPVGVLGGPVGGWSLQSAPVRAQSLMPYAVHDGPAVHERTRDLVSESVEVWIPKQASSYDLRDKVQAIETLLEKANRGGEVWVEYNTGEASDNLWRSPLMAGGLAWGPDMRLRWRNWEAHVRVIYSREPWWQGDSRTAQLASGSTLANASAPTVGQAGRVTARASNDAGVLPAPFKLTWTLPSHVGGGPARLRGAEARRVGQQRRGVHGGEQHCAHEFDGKDAVADSGGGHAVRDERLAAGAGRGHGRGRAAKRRPRRGVVAARWAGHGGGSGRTRRVDQGRILRRAGRAGSAIWEHFTWRAATFTSWHTPTARCSRRRCGYTCCRPTATARTFTWRATARPAARWSTTAAS